MIQMFWCSETLITYTFVIILKDVLLCLFVIDNCLSLFDPASTPHIAVCPYRIKSTNSTPRAAIVVCIVCSLPPLIPASPSQSTPYNTYTLPDH